ncbi:hypothetical protein Tco_1073248 [Tanacetum coccineum]
MPEGGSAPCYVHMQSEPSTMLSFSLHNPPEASRIFDELPKATDVQGFENKAKTSLYTIKRTLKVVAKTKRTLRGGCTARWWWVWPRCATVEVAMVEADGGGQRCDDEVMVMFDEEMWWGGDGWRGEAAGGRIWWLVVSPEKCGGARKTGRENERERMSLGFECD